MTLENCVAKIQYTKQDNIFILKLTGEVRLTLCTALDQAIEKLFQDNACDNIFVDLNEAVSLDSTTLGLLAKLAIFSKQTYKIIPTVETNNEDIIRLLDSMGIKESFNIIASQNHQWQNLKDLATGPCNEAFVKEKVLEAHRILMEVNDNNKIAFEDLVKTLESQ